MIRIRRARGEVSPFADAVLSEPLSFAGARQTHEFSFSNSFFLTELTRASHRPSLRAGAPLPRLAAGHYITT